MQLMTGAKTHSGLKRSHNEDSFCNDRDLDLHAIWDGMGGPNAGEVASGLELEVIQRHLRETSTNGSLPLIRHDDTQFSSHTNRLASAIRLANASIRRSAKADPEREGMGTTVVAGLIRSRILSLAHVGDSRLYLVRGQNLLPLMVDHSLVAEQVRLWLLTSQEAEGSASTHPYTRVGHTRAG
jgi:serine/threonine protein phosphatase PrpC